MENNFSVSELCSIIKTCRINGVRTLKLGDISIYFGTSQSKPKTDPKKNPPKDEILETLSENALLEDEIKTRELELDEMLLTDPVQYEQLALRGDLEDGISESDE